MASTNYLDYPVGSPERAQLQAQEQAANRAAAEQEYEKARARRDQQVALTQAQKTQREQEQYSRKHDDQMGFAGRIGDFFVQGLGKALEAPFGGIYDLARAAVRDDTRVMDALPASITQRAGQELGSWFGPRGVFGSLIGLIPRAVRDPLHEQTQLTGEAMANTRREVIIEPLTRLMVGKNPLGGLHETGAYDDQTLPNTVGRAVVSWWDGDSSKGWSQVVSGGLDLVSSLYLDPAVIGGKASAAVKAKVLEGAGYGTVRDAASLSKVVESNAFADFTERAVAGKTPQEIHTSLFSQHPNGLQLSTVLAEAYDAAGPEGVKVATKAMLGDKAAAAELAKRAEGAAVTLDNTSSYLDTTQEALRAVRSEAADVATAAKVPAAGVPSRPPIFDPSEASPWFNPEIQAGQTAQTQMFEPPPAPPVNYAGRISELEGQSATLGTQKAAATRELAMAKRAQGIYGEMDRLPRQTFAGATRLGENRIGRAIQAVDRSDWIQNSPYARPVRVVYEGGKSLLFERLPKNRVNLNSPHSAIDLERMLKTSGMDAAEVDGWMNRYGQTVNGTERRAIFDQAEVTSIKTLADDAGLSVEDVDQLLGAQKSGRAALADRLNARIYGGDGRDLLVLDEADRPLTQVHMFTESGAADEFRLSDFHQVRRVVTKWGQFKANHPGAALIPNILHEANDLWRPAQLLKVSTSAVIQMDQQLRIYLKLGALDQFGSILKRGTRYIWDATKGVEDDARGLRPFDYRGVTGPGPWGTSTEEAALTKALNSSRGVQKLLDSSELGQRSLFGSLPDAKTIYPTEASHATELARLLNNEIGDDAVNRMLLEGRSVDDVTAWLGTPEGQAYTADIPIKRRDPRGWVEARAQHVEDMTAGNRELRALALEKKVTANDIETALPDPATRPLVNRLLTDQMHGKSTTIRTVNKIVDGFFRTVQSWPDDVLSRNTLYTELYDAEMKRLVDVFAEGKTGNPTIPDATMEHFGQLAREKSLRTTKDMLYDLADQSRASELLRFAVPFFEPVREQVTVFGQLIGEAPQRYFRVRALLRAPLRSGLVFDEKGNRITETGRHVDPMTGQEVAPSERGTRELLKFNLPSWTRGIPYFGEILGGRTTTVDLGQLRGKAGIPTGFGWGPAVSIPVNQVARNRPELATSLKFLLPYGVTDDSILRQLEPGFAKKFNDASNRDDDNRTMRGAEASAMLSKLTQFRQTNGRVPTAAEKLKLEKEAISEASAFMHLRAGVNYLAPFSIGFDTPYKPYADAFRAAQAAWSTGEKNKDQTGGKNLTLADAQGNERDPNQWFLDTFGDEYYALTQSVTHTNNGIPATVEGQVAEKKYRDLIEAYPDLGGLIVGSEGAGEYNRTVALAQQRTETRPGSGVKEREYLPLSGAPGRPGISDSPEISLGWQYFGAVMDQIDALRKQRGLTSLGSKAGADLAAAKTAVVQTLSAAYPAWADAYGQSDQNAWKRKIEGLTAIAADKRLANRPEIRLLGNYLEARQGIAAVLATRKSKTLTAQSNADVAEAWEQIGNLLVDQNLAFGDLYHRYLERDPVVTP